MLDQAAWAGALGEGRAGICVRGSRARTRWGTRCRPAGSPAGPSSARPAGCWPPKSPGRPCWCTPAGAWVSAACLSLPGARTTHSLGPVAVPRLQPAQGCMCRAMRTFMRRGAAPSGAPITQIAFSLTLPSKGMCTSSSSSSSLQRSGTCGRSRRAAQGLKMVPTLQAGSASFSTLTCAGPREPCACRAGSPSLRAQLGPHLVQADVGVQGVGRATLGRLAVVVVRAAGLKGRHRAPQGKSTRATSCSTPPAMRPGRGGQWLAALAPGLVMLGPAGCG